MEFLRQKVSQNLCTKSKIEPDFEKIFQKKDFVSEYSSATENIEYSFQNAAKKISTESQEIFRMLSRNKFESMSLEKSVFSSKYSSGREN